MCVCVCVCVFVCVCVCVQGQADYITFRAVVLQNILATDMARYLHSVCVFGCVECTVSNRTCSFKIECVLYTLKSHSVCVVCARAHVCALVPIDPSTPSSLSLSHTHHERVCVCPIYTLRVLCVLCVLYVLCVLCVCQIDTDSWVVITWDCQQSLECPPCMCVCVCVCVCG